VRRNAGSALVAASLASLVLAPPAGATFPGINGGLAYSTTAGPDASLEWLLLGGSSLPAAAPVRLAGDARDVHWSPDGGAIAFTSERDGNPEIYSLDLTKDGAAPVRLTRSPGLDADPSWSRDGRRIAFTSDRSGNRDIWVMDADGGNPARLTTDPAVDQQAEFSPVAGRIAFESERDGDRELYAMNADGTGQTRLTFDPGVDADASWSPDGSRLAFTTDGGIGLIGAGGGPVEPFTRFAPADQFPAWSPDGHQIAFTRSGAQYVQDYPATASSFPTYLGPGVDADWGDLPPSTPGLPVSQTATLDASPKVEVQPPGADAPKPLGSTDERSIPVGTKVVATVGGTAFTVDLALKSLEATVQGGTYTVTRTVVNRAPTLDLHLSAPGCARAASGPTATASVPIDIVRVRKHKGPTRTWGNHFTAAGYTTDWTMKVRCGVTIVEVHEGVVHVRDRRRHRTVVVTAHHRFVGR
jgi:TolB protein